MALRGLPASQTEEHSIGRQEADVKCVVKLVHAWAAVVSAKPDIWRGTEAGQMQLDVFSLALSVLKTAASLKSTVEGMSIAEANMLVFAETFAAPTARLLELWQAAAAQTADAAPSSSSSSSVASSSSSSGGGSSSSSSSGSTSPGVLCLLLQARFVHMIGKHFEAAGRVYAASTKDAAADDATDEVTDTCFRVPAGFTNDNGLSEGGAVGDLMESCGAGVTRMLPLLLAAQLPGAAGSEAACEAAKQQLQQLLAKVTEAIEGNIRVLAGAKQGGQLGVQGLHEQLVTQLQRVGEGLPSLGQQLVLFAEAVCAQLPLPLCCNNPNCQELLGASCAAFSEQRLLTVKSVCTGCRWVTVPELRNKLPFDCCPYV
jgi:hypothetical protein